MRRPHSSARGGFTLAEVAVTLVIVGATLVLVLQGMNSAKVTAAHTRNQRLASELARLTLGRIAAGLFQEDVDIGGYLSGSYAEEGYPEFTWEIALGDEPFPDIDEDDDLDDGRFDSWTWNDDEEEEDEEAVEPFETVKVRVSYPALSDHLNELVLEQWIDWEQVYGEEEEE